MSIYLLELVEAIRQRLDDVSDKGATPSGYYAYWQYDDADYLWKNKELIRYLKQALRDLGLRAPIAESGIDADSTIAYARANRSEVELDSRILTIEQARLASAQPPVLLIKTTSHRLDAEYGGTAWRTWTGTPTHYWELRKGWISLFPIPVVNDTLYMVVCRGYSTDFLWDSVANEQTPMFTLDDIDDGLWEALVLGTCKYAYQKRDSDTFNLPLAQDCERQLQEIVGPPVSIRQREARRENANLSIVIRGHSYHNTAKDADKDWP